MLFAVTVTGAQARGSFGGVHSFSSPSHYSAPVRYSFPTVRVTSPTPTRVTVTPTVKAPTKVTVSPTVKPSTPTVLPGKTVLPTSVKTTAPVQTTAKPIVSTKPSSVPTASTPTKTSIKPIVLSGQTYKKTGAVVGSTYKPTFSGGYTPPAGSTVYYRQSSMMDWLPFYMIMTMNSHQQAVVMTPASSTTPATTKVVEEKGVDSMYVINIIVSILFSLGFIWLVVWLLTKSKKENNYV